MRLAELQKNILLVTEIKKDAHNLEKIFIYSTGK